MGSKNATKKKGPRGKKARAKAKLDRQWGETAVIDDENQTRRVGKSRLKGKQRYEEKKMKETTGSVHWGGNVTEPTRRNKKSITEPVSVLKNKNEGSNPGRLNGNDSDSEDSAVQENPMASIMKIVGKSTKKKSSTAGKRRAVQTVGLQAEKMDPEVDYDNAVEDSDMDVEEENNSSNESSDGSDEALEADPEEDIDDDDLAEDDAVETGVDYFRQRFSRGPLEESEINNPNKALTKVLVGEELELHVSTFAGESDLEGLLPTKKQSKKTMGEWHSVAAEAFAGNRQVLKRQWKRVHKRLTDNQAPIYSFLTRYADMLISTESRKYRKEMEKIYLLHTLNHVLTARGRIQRNNRMVKELEAAQEEEDSNGKPMEEIDEDKVRDQGFTRPSVLVLLPTRSTCHRFVTGLLNLAGCEVDNEHQNRFEGDYGMDENEETDVLGTDQERRRKMILKEKGKDWNEFFGDNVNQDDDFKLGLSIQPKAAKKKKTKQKEKASNVMVKLYTDFYKSDVIVTSPLGLKMLMTSSEESKGSNADYLSSIEICLVQYADVIMMQNWDHVNEILGHLNQEPANNNNTDFSRVRKYLLEFQGAHWRQLIISTNVVDPYLLSTFKRFGKSVAGSVKVKRPILSEAAALSNVLVPIKQVFQKVPALSFGEQSDARVNYFVKTILPTILRHKQKHTLIYIPSYFDFVALRNIFLKRELSFVSVTEYSRTSEVSRGRARFLQGRKPIMLFTGRCNFFHRHAIKGAHHLIFLGLPEHAKFYSDHVNRIQQTTTQDHGEDEMEVASSVSSCLALFTRYEGHALERVVGSSNCVHMLGSNKATFMFYS